MASQETIRAVWTNEQKKFLIDLGIEEKKKGNDVGASLKVNAWNRIREQFKLQFKVSYSQRQMKNQWDQFKKQYGAWKKLNAKTGHGVSPTTGAADCPQDLWEKYIKEENPDAKIFRFKGLQWEEELEFLFDKVVAKGEYAYASGSDSLPSRRSVTSSQFSENHFEDIIDVDTEVVDTPVSNDGINPSQQREKHKKKNKTMEIRGEIEAILKTLAKDADQGPTIEDCRKSLNKMSTLSQEDDLYYVALQAFVEITMTPKQCQLLKMLLLKLLLKYKRQLKFCGPKNRINTSLVSGKAFIETEILQGSPTLCYELFRMNKQAFRNLCSIFKSRGWLEDGDEVVVEEQMAMFLLTIGHNCRNRLVKQRFQHSGWTVHHYFHKVLNAMVLFSREMIVSPPFDEFPNASQYNRRIQQIFKGAIGAIDGTLIHASIKTGEQIPYRARGRNECYQNVMAICDFNMVFTYVVIGWEGTAHDSRVLQETMQNPSNHFPLPPNDRYYLVDAAYTNTRCFLAPYENVRYWLPDFQSGGRARTKEEVFNHTHARLRNVIERAFGVLKMKCFKHMKMKMFHSEDRITHNKLLLKLQMEFLILEDKHTWLT